MLKSIFKLVCPPLIYNALISFRKRNNQKNKPAVLKKILDRPEKQDLELYWDPEYAKVLDEWGKDNVWNEIQMLLIGCKGQVLDIACGTGVTMKILEKYTAIQVYGFDISDLLIQKAKEKGIFVDRLRVADATNTDYPENKFDYSYSIGSLEHFTFEGIDAFIRESARYTKNASFHMIPVSRSGKDEGWMKTVQSFFNNSESWWYERFRRHFEVVYCIPSKWEDQISYGRWFICIK